MATQDVKVVNNDVGCGLLILMAGLMMGGCTMSAQLCKRLDGIERAILKTKPAEDTKQHEPLTE